MTFRRLPDSSSLKTSFTVGQAPRRAERALIGARLFAVLASAGLGFALPVVMVVANKSAPAVLGGAALFANLGAGLGGYGPALKVRYRAMLASPVVLAAALSLALAAISLAWTIDVGFTRRGLVEGIPELVFALAMAAAWPLVAQRRDALWLVAGIIVAGALVLFEHRAGMPLHVIFRERAEVWDLKRSAIPPALLMWPALHYCLDRQRWPLAVLILAAVAAGIVASHSGAPGFALIAAAAVYVLARLAPRLALGLTAAALLALVVAAPWTGTLATRLLPPSVEDALRDEHASHRIRIWTAFEDRLHDRPILGHGFDTSFKMSVTPRPGDKPLGADNDAMVDIHPHNVFLQIWVELGLAGALLSLAVLGFILRRLARADPGDAAPRLALLVTVAGVGLVGLSAWQPWWLASIAAALLWSGLIDASRPGPGSQTARESAGNPTRRE